MLLPLTDPSPRPDLLVGLSHWTPPGSWSGDFIFQSPRPCPIPSHQILDKTFSAPLYPLQDFKALHKYCIIIIILQHSISMMAYHHHHWYAVVIWQNTTPQPFYGHFSGTTRVSQCQKRTSGLYSARED